MILKQNEVSDQIQLAAKELHAHLAESFEPEAELDVLRYAA